MTDTPAGPGWYEDPDDADQLRYFDGVVWSSHTNPRKSPTADRSNIGRAVQPGPGAGSWGAPGSAGPPGAPPHGGGRQPSGQGGPGAHPGWGAAPGSQGGWNAARTDVLPDGSVLAEWWRRLLARILDSIFSSVLGLIVAIPWLGPAMDVLERALRDFSTAASAGNQPDIAGFSADFAEALLPVTMVSLVVSLVYEIGFLTWKSATPGKMLLGTVVRRVGDGEPIGLVTAARRQVVGLVASAIAFVPFLGLFSTVLNVLDPAWLLWDPKRQALHDKVADTVVVLRR